jgi:hypothetical protein
MTMWAQVSHLAHAQLAMLPGNMAQKEKQQAIFQQEILRAMLAIQTMPHLLVQL